MQRLQSYNVMGADISNNNGEVDMTTWKQNGIQFVYAKTSEGNYYRDTFFNKNVAKAKAVGLPIGGYHFARPEECDADSEAQIFLSMIQGQNLELCPVLDLEAGNVSTDHMIAWVNRWREIVENATGMRVILYTGKWYADRFNGFNGALADMPLWYANYTSDMNVQLPSFGGFDDWVAWQFTESGQLAGIRTHVDLDYARSLDSLMQRIVPKKNYNLTQAQEVRALLDGNPINGWEHGILVEDETHVIWTILNVLGIGNEFKGDGLFVINGQPVQGYIYNGNTYLPWSKVGKQLFPIKIDGGVSFMTTAPTAGDWRVDMGAKAIDSLVAHGLIDPAGANDWKAKALEPAEVWLLFVMMQRMVEKGLK